MALLSRAVDREDDIGPMPGPDGEMIAPTNKTFELEFCTVARWKEAQIVEEKLFYDQVGLMQ